MASDYLRFVVVFSILAALTLFVSGQRQSESESRPPASERPHQAASFVR